MDSPASITVSESPHRLSSPLPGGHIGTLLLWQVLEGQGRCLGRPGRNGPEDRPDPLETEDRPSLLDGPVFVLLIAGFAGIYSRTDRSSLLRSRNGAGMCLFRRTSPVAPNEAGFQGGHDSLGVFDEALTGRGISAKPIENFRDLFARIFSKGSK